MTTKLFVFAISSNAPYKGPNTVCFTGNLGRRIERAAPHRAGCHSPWGSQGNDMKSTLLQTVVVALACSTVSATPINWWASFRPAGVEKVLQYQSIDFDLGTFSPSQQPLVYRGTAPGFAMDNQVSWDCWFSTHEFACSAPGGGLRLYSYEKPEGWGWADQIYSGQPLLTGMSQLVFDAILFAESRTQGQVPINGLNGFVTLGSQVNSPSYDLNGDGTIDAGDAGLLFGQWTGDAVPSVPEPSLPTGTMALMGLAALRSPRRVVPICDR